jgi:branched-chain amino acid transport system permease protein
VLNAVTAGITIGCIYGLMCIGLGLIFGIMRIVNFARASSSCSACSPASIVTEQGALVPRSVLGPFVGAICAPLAGLHRRAPAQIRDRASRACGHGARQAISAS